MFCPNCGKEVEEGAKFCQNCGASLSASMDVASDDDQRGDIGNNYSTAGTSADETKTVLEEESQSPSQSYTQPISVNQTMPASDINATNPPTRSSGNTAAGILYILGAVLLLFDGFRTIGFDWGIISLIAGIGMLVVGILQFTKVKPRVSSIIKIVFGVLTLGISCFCILGFDWTYIGLLGGFLLLVSGVLGLFRISPIIVSIIEIILSAALLIFGFLCLGFVWGDTALAISIPVLVCAIIRLVRKKKGNNGEAVVDEQKTSKKRTPVIIAIIAAILIIIVLIVLLSSGNSSSKNTTKDDVQETVFEEEEVVVEEPDITEAETEGANISTVGKPKSNIDTAGTLENTGETADIHFSITSEQKDFINKNLNLFPAEEEDFKDLETYFDTSLDYAHVIKNPQRYVGSFVFIPSLLVLRAFEENLSSYEYDNFSAFNVMDSNGNFYMIYYTGKSVDAVEGDLIDVVAMPLDYITYESVSGDNVFCLVMVASILENDNSPELLTAFISDVYPDEIEQTEPETNEEVTINQDYILPESDTRYYTADELSGLTKDELRIARNEIYARHGRVFDSADLNDYFNSKSWYNGTIPAAQFSEDLLNVYEKANAATIQSVENGTSTTTSTNKPVADTSKYFYFGSIYGMYDGPSDKNIELHAEIYSDNSYAYIHFYSPDGDQDNIYTGKLDRDGGNVFLASDADGELSIVFEDDSVTMYVEISSDHTNNKRLSVLSGLYKHQ